MPQCEYSPGCHPVDGCIIKYREGGGCDDGNLCTTNDFCCSRLDVGPPCNLERKCVGGPPVVCSALDQCHDVGTCNPATGVCSNPPKANGTPCTDSNVCTLNDTCQSGTCAPGAVKDCRETPTDNVCTIDSCDPVRDCQHSAPVTRCDAANSTGGFVGGPNNTQCANGTRDANNNCTVSTGVVDLTFPPEALTTPTNINIISTPATPGGACDFTLENFLSKVASCIELEPSGQKFNSPVTATFKWTNTTSQCLVGATAKDGSATALQEGTLTVHWKGQCNAGKCEDTTTPCTGTSCNIQLTPRCDAKQLPSTCQICCPACPGAGCTGSALNYSCLKPDPLSPCTGTPSCSPGANKWTVPLTHFSDYALGFNPPPPDHFQCYKSGLLSTTSLPAPLTLVDRFGTVSASIIKPLKLCSPTDKDGEDPDAVSHANYLQSYGIELLNRRALDARLPVRGQNIVDTFGTHTVDVRLPDRFLVPTTENVDSQPLAPDASVLDHFTCYKVKQTKGTPRFAKTTVTVVDQFDQFPQTITLKKPAHLCVPSDKNGEQPGAEDNRWQLMCYRASRPFVQVRRRFTNNELGPSYVYPLFREELCVPALKG